MFCRFIDGTSPLRVNHAPIINPIGSGVRISLSLPRV
jgi:hypothetical protein